MANVSATGNIDDHSWCFDWSGERIDICRRRPSSFSHELHGVFEERVAAFIYLFAMLAAVSPPINLWAMLMAAQANMPYVGFNVVLLVPIVIIALFTIVYTGTSKTPGERAKNTSFRTSTST